MGVADRAVYRVWQFWQALWARPLQPEERDAVLAILNPQEMELFFSQSTSSQRHGFRVMCRLQDAGHEDKALLAAALLHDVGKARLASAWWDRPVVVLAEALVPSRAAKWSSGEVQFWNRPFVVKACHAEWGAEAARAATSSTITVALIRRHQDPPVARPNSREDRLLGLLQQADDVS